MILPTHVNIFGRTFKIQVTNLDGEEVGFCNRDTNTILIEASQSDEDKIHTLIHEICHAVFGRISLNQAVSQDVEEIIVDSIATALVENKLISIDACSLSIS